MSLRFGLGMARQSCKLFPTGAKISGGLDELEEGEACSPSCPGAQARGYTSATEASALLAHFSESARPSGGQHSLGRVQGSFLPLSVTPRSISQRPTDPLPPPTRSPSAKGSRGPFNHWLPRPRRFFLEKIGATGANGSQEQRFLLQGPSSGLAGQDGLFTGQARAPAAQPSPPLLLP